VSVIARLDEFGAEDTIFAESATPDARAEVAPEDADTNLPYLLEVDLAREAIEVWQAFRPGETPTLESKLEAVTYYAENDAWLPVAWPWGPASRHMVVTGMSLPGG
jgi:hypothetical protein